MYIRKTYINESFADDYTDKARDDVFVPVTQPSVTYKIWNAVLDIKTCFICAENHGRIFAFNDSVLIKPPVHIGCRCALEGMEAIEAGKAIVHLNLLPEECSAVMFTAMKTGNFLQKLVVYGMKQI